MKKVGIAVLDSGIEPGHPDFATTDILFRDFIHQRDSAYDDYGHGTHIAGILCGNGAASNGKYAGITPGAQLICGKILDSHGNGENRVLYDALDWIGENSKQWNIQVINLSLGGGTQGRETIGPVLQRLDDLWEQGICIVCAAGNTGPGPGTVSKIGIGEKRICVGCYDYPHFVKNKRPCMAYSGRGKGNNLGKPDLVAPGTDIVSCNHLYGKKQGRWPYVAKSGTSMATAIVAGIVAKMYEWNPTLKNDQIMQILRDTATDCGLEKSQQGSGMVNYKNILTLLG